MKNKLRTFLLAAIVAFIVGFFVNALVARAAQTAVQIGNGGTGIGTTPSYGQLLVGNSSGGYSLVATSSLGIQAAGVNSFIGRTGAIVAQLGDYTTSLVTEGSNLYFTTARAITALTGANLSIFTNDVGYLTSATLGPPFYSLFHATTTDALTEGSTNLYFTNVRSDARFITDLAATTSVKSITTLSGLSLPYSQLTGTPAIASSTLLGDANTFSGVDSFTNVSSNFGGTWQTFAPSHFQSALSAPTFPITLTGTTLGFAGLTTSTNAVQGSVPYFSGANTFANEATGTIICTGTAACGVGSYVLGANLTITGSAGSSASSTLLGDTNRFSGLDTFANGALFTASTTFTGNATTTGMFGVGSLFINNNRFTNLLGTGLSNIAGALGVDLTAAFSWTGLHTFSASTTLATTTTSVLNHAITIDGTHYAYTSAGINQAIADVSAEFGGGEVYLPASVYNINSRAAPKNNVWVHGAGKGNTVLKGAVGGDWDFYYSSVSVPLLNFKITDLTIDLQNTANSGAIEFQNSSSTEISRVSFINGAAGGWFINYSSAAADTVVVNNNNKAIDDDFNGHAGTLEMLLVANSENMQIIRPTWTNISSPGIGLWQADYDTHIDSPYCSNSTNGQIYYNITTERTTINSPNLNNCQGIIGAGTSDNGAFGLTQSKTLKITDPVLIGGANSSTTNGIELGAVNSATIINPHIEGYASGIAIDGGDETASSTPLNWSIIGGEIRNVNTINNNPLLHCGIYISTSTPSGLNENGLIQGVQIYDDQASPTQKFPICFDSENGAVTYDGIQIINNRLSAPASLGGTSIVLVNSSALGTSMQIYGNRDYTGTNPAQAFYVNNGLGILNGLISAASSTFSAILNVTGTLNALGGLNASSTVKFGNAGIAGQFVFNGSTGRVGIASSTPDSGVSVDNYTGRALLHVGDDATNDSTTKLLIENRWSGAGGYGLVVQRTGTIPQLVVDGNGNVGVGTSTPWKQLSVGNSNTGTFAISTSTSGCAQFSALGEFFSTGTACGTGSSVSGAATSSFVGTAPLRLTTSNASITYDWTGLATTSQLSSGNLLVSNGAAGVFGVATGTETISGPLTGSSFTIVGSGGSLGCTTVASGVAGCLSSTMFDTFNNKQAALTATWPQILTGATLSFGGLSTSTAAVQGNIPYFSGVNTFANVATGTISGSGGITATAGQSVIGSGLTIGCTVADTSHTGCVTSTDWNTFNGKDSFAYPFLSSATSSSLMLLASTTIGAGGTITGLTISGGATTTGTATFQSGLNLTGSAIATTFAGTQLSFQSGGVC